MGEQASSRVMDILEFLEDFVGCTAEDTIAVVHSGSNECMAEKDRDGRRRVVLFKGEKDCFGDVFDVLNKGEGVGVFENETTFSYGSPCELSMKLSCLVEKFLFFFLFFFFYRYKDNKSRR